MGNWNDGGMNMNDYNNMPGMPEFDKKALEDLEKALEEGEKEDWEKMLDEAAKFADDNKLPGTDDWEKLADDIADGIEQALEAYDQASGAFEEGMSSKSVGLTAAFAASALAVTSSYF